MTREEEIRARLENAQVNASSYPVTVMDADIVYLLARNEELQRRVELVERVIVLARQYVKAIRLDERAELCVALSALTLPKTQRNAK